MKKTFTFLGVLSALLMCAFPVVATGNTPDPYAVSAEQSTITVKGKVVDTAGGPIAGASVIEAGTTNGTFTDGEGTFTITVMEGATLEAGFLGFITKAAKVTGTNMTFVLDEDVEVLEETVVIGYGTLKKSDLSGSVVSVSAEDMEKRNPSNLGVGLQGIAPGVQVIRSSGDPEGGFSIRIRGVATVNGSADPLYVVDGVQVGSSIDFLNPSDVESIEILKDASATAIYGTKGANGVVLVTTKKGGKGKTNLNISANVGVQFNANHLEMADADLFTSAVRTAVKDDNIAMTNLAYSEQYKGKLNNINWQNEVTRPALRQKYDVSASGGNENTRANISFGYLNNQGIILNSFFNRITARANVTHKIKNFIHVGANIQYTHNERTGGGNLRNIAAAIPTMDYVEDGKFYSMPIKLADGSWGHYKKEGNGDVPKGLDNQVASLMESDNITKGNRILASASLQIDIMKGLVFKAIGSYNLSTSAYNGYSRWHDRTYGAEDRKDSFSLNQSQNNDLGLESYLTYNLNKKNHRLSAMAGFSLMAYNGSYLNASASDFAADTIRDLGLTQDTSTRNSGGALSRESRFASYFARFNYTYDDRDIVTATVRRDGSSNFGAGNRWGTFPSAAVAWNISNEGFMSDVDIISNLKLRAGWGQTGNAGNNTNLSVPQLGSNGTAYWIDDKTSVNIAPGIAQLKEIDTNLKWETNEQTNIGIDLGMWNDSFTVSADYFIRDAKDLLLYRKIRISTGFEQVYTNAGHIRNSGFEIMATYKKNIGDFFFSVSANATTLKNKAIEVGDPIFSKDKRGGGAEDGDQWDNHSVTMNGYPVGSYYGYRVAGIFQSQSEIDALNAKAPADPGYYQDKTTKPGDYKFVDINKDGTITDADREVIGHGFPTLTYGFILNLSYKNFDFSMNTHGVAGIDILSYSSARLQSVYNPTGGYQNVLSEYINNAWSETNKTGTAHRISKTDNNKNYRVSDVYIKKGDYFKISNIQFGYSLPKNVVRRARMENVRVYVSADNLATFSPYKKYGDPEIGSSNVLFTGFDSGRYPFPMSVSFGLNVTF